MRLRHAVIAIVLSTGALVPAAVSGTAAWAGPAPGPAAVQKAKPAKPIRPVKPAKPAKPVKVTFTAAGAVTGVDAAAGTVTLVARGGTKDVRGHTVTVLVPGTARIVLDDAPATLADLTAGFRITVTGTRAGTVHTASKVQAHSPEPADEPEDD